jgi:hypothetical protein
MIEKLPPEIAKLLEREANARADDVALKELVRRRVESAIVLGTPAENVGGAKSLASASAAAAKGIAAPFVALIGVGAFVAGTAFGIAVHRSSPSLPSPTSTPPTSSATSTESVVPIEDKAASSSIAVPLPPVVTASQTSTNDDPSTQTGDLIRERELLDVARSAMSHGRPQDAIAAAKRHEKRWPKGYLVEEREVVWIQALVATGEYDEAKTHAASFHKKFPRSALTSAVDAAIEEANSATSATDSGVP